MRRGGKNRLWTNDDDMKLVTLYLKNEPIQDIADSLGRSRQAIYARAHVLDVSRTTVSEAPSRKELMYSRMWKRKEQLIALEDLLDIRFELGKIAKNMSWIEYAIFLKDNEEAKHIGTISSREFSTVIEFTTNLVRELIDIGRIPR